MMEEIKTRLCQRLYSLAISAGLVILKSAVGADWKMTARRESKDVSGLTLMY